MRQGSLQLRNCWSPLNKPAAILWDMDGTLVDTEPYWINAEIKLATQAGGVWSREDGLSLVGFALLKSAQILKERAGLQGSHEEIVTSLLTLVANQMRDQGIPWQEGARELLDDLRQANIPCALVTMSYPLLSDVMVQALPASTFDVIVTGDIVTNGKPDPEPYLLAAEKLGVDITHCVAIEDSPSGVASAEAAGAKTIVVPHLIDIPAASGRSRVASLAQLSVEKLSAIAEGEALDLLS